MRHGIVRALRSAGFGSGPCQAGSGPRNSNAARILDRPHRRLRPDAYAKYVSANARALAKFGGKFLVRGGRGRTVEGRARPRHVVIEFPSYQDALACYRSPEYAKAFAHRRDAFGAPLRDLTREDLTRPGTVFQIGLPPLRIDVLTSLTGVTFGAAWDERTEAEFEGVRFPVLGRRQLLVNKRALGRAQDLADIERLESEG